LIRGEIVDSRTFNILSSLRQVSEERSGGAAKGTWRVIGQFILVLFMFLSFYMYLLYFRPSEYRNRKHVVFMLLLIFIFVALTALTVRFDLFSVYIIPYTILTILIRTFIDSRTALFGEVNSIATGHVT
jgi:membrane-associated HD superfamily phosphohydrolase